MAPGGKLIRSRSTWPARRKARCPRTGWASRPPPGWCPSPGPLGWSRLQLVVWTVRLAPPGLAGAWADAARARRRPPPPGQDNHSCEGQQHRQPGGQERRRDQGDGRAGPAAAAVTRFAEGRDDQGQDHRGERGVQAERVGVMQERSARRAPRRPASRSGRRGRRPSRRRACAGGPPGRARTPRSRRSSRARRAAAASPGRPPAEKSGRARPYGRWLALTSSPARAAARGLPPAATIPMNRNSEAPASTSTLCAAGTQTGNPEATAMAP